MSFFGQRIVNKFPLWAKLRTDPSSFGYRFLSAFGEYFENALVEKLKIRDALRLLSKDLGRGFIYELPLVSDDYISIEIINGFEKPILPSSVIGYQGNSSYTLRSISSPEEFFYGLSERLIFHDTIDVDNWLIWESSAPTVFNTIETPERLCIQVSNSSIYKKQSETSEELFGGFSGVILKGVDPNWQDFKEYIQVSDDGIFLTSNLFRSLTEVSIDGFDGSIEITLIGKNLSLLTDPFRFAVTSELEGPLYFELDGDTLVVKTPILTNGVEYRRPESDLVTEDNNEVIAEHLLLDSNEESYTPVDIAISPYNSHLYSLDTNGYIHIYDYSLSSFHKPTLDFSEESYISIVPLKSRVRFNEELWLWTWFRVLRSPVVKVSILKYAPDGTTSYLQSDLSWASTVDFFLGDPDNGLPENTWTGFRFTSLFDQVGQWDFYINVYLRGSSEPFVGYIGVYCEKLIAMTDLVSDISEPDGLFFDESSMLCISKDNTYYRFSEAIDVYIPDFDNQRLILREQYDTVTVQNV